MKKHKFAVETVKMTKKGQVTIPKWIRKEQEFKGNDEMLLTQMPDGEMKLRKKQKTDGIDLMLEAIKRSKKFDWRKAWEEVKEERAKEHR